jgi:hypothetical protein
MGKQQPKGLKTHTDSSVTQLIDTPFGAFPSTKHLQNNCFSSS